MPDNYAISHFPLNQTMVLSILMNGYHPCALMLSVSAAPPQNLVINALFLPILIVPPLLTPFAFNLLLHHHQYHVLVNDKCIKCTPNCPHSIESTTTKFKKDQTMTIQVSFVIVVIAMLHWSHRSQMSKTNSSHLLSVAR